MAGAQPPTTTVDLDFERPIAQLERQIAELERALRADDAGPDLSGEIRRLRKSHTAMLRKVYDSLGRWDTVKVARHPNRPQGRDYLEHIVKDFCELHGDRRFGDDAAIATGLGRIGVHKCMVIAHCKGKDTKTRLKCNFGMGHPEGYRKAMLKMKLAEKYGLPVVALVDTPGAFPGVGAEERGQAEAIAVNIQEMSRLRSPIVCVIIGEGGSGGALGIAVGDRCAMLQYAWYSVISPEACSSILWRSGEQAATAAEALRLTAADNLGLGVIDEVIDEPLGGAHRHPQAAMRSVEKWIVGALRELKKKPVEKLLSERYERIRAMGKVSEGAEVSEGAVEA